MTLDTKDNYLQNEFTNSLSNDDSAAFLNLNPIPTVVYDRTLDQILKINYTFIKLTGFSQTQIEKMPLEMILKGDIDTNPTQSCERPVLLKTHTGETIDTNLSIETIDQTHRQVALLFHPEKPKLDIKQDLIAQELTFDNFKKVLEIGNFPDLHSTIEFVLELIDELIKTDEISFYILNEAKSSLIKIFTRSNDDADNFPPQLSIEDIKNLQSIYLWKVNKKQKSLLHQFAHDIGYKYFLNIPLLQNDQWMGLITIAGYLNPPNDENLRLLSFIGIQTSQVAQHLITLENARIKIQNIKKILQIQQIAVDNLEEGVIVLTPDLKVAEMNPAAEITLGYASKEVYLQQIQSILIGNESLASAYKSALEGIPMLVSSDLRLHNRTGKSFPAQIMTLPVILNEELIGIIILLRDISQTEKIIARTQQLEQRAFLGEISAVFAHEVKNPINSLMTGLQYIGMTLEANSPHSDLVARLQNDCLRLTHLMDSVLTFSKPNEYHFLPVDLSIVIPQILERWGPRIRRLNINPFFESCVDHPTVNGDARALEQVFVNLISNAVQAMDTKGGSLSVRIVELKKSGSIPSYDVIISDTGPGIPNDIIDHIFEPFMTTNPNGTGLGLAISKRIITAHKGNINVESFPGGTLFHVVLPKIDGETS